MSKPDDFVDFRNGKTRKHVGVIVIGKRLTSFGTVLGVFFFWGAVVTPGLTFAQQKTDEQARTSLKSDASLITLTVIVTNKKGSPVQGLPQSAFTVLTDDVPQEITSFDNQDSPVSLAIMFGLSFGAEVSTHYNDKLRAVLDALPRLVQTGNNSNEYFIVGFSNQPRLLLDSTVDSRAVLDVISKIGLMEFGGKSAIFDACHFTLNKLKQSKYQRKAILLVSLNNDYESQKEFKDIQHLLREDNVMFYAIHIGVDDEPQYESPERKRTTFEKLSDEPNVLVFNPKMAKDTVEVLERLAMELRHQYTITFKPAKPVATGKCHSFNVKVKAPVNNPNKFLRVRNRERHCPIVGSR